MTLIVICVISFGFMLWASRTDSAIDDELAHIPAGYGYVHNLDYRLNPEHPPLIKALAMLPVLILNPSFPTGSDAWKNQVNAQWAMGSEFLYQSGNDANAIIRTARIMPILITILLIIFIYLLARRLMGTWWALLPSFLFALSPNVLAHGHYVTTDVGAAFGILFATYFFLKFIESPSRKHLWWAGLSFGAAQLMKFSAPLLVPLFIFLAIVLWLRDATAYWGESEHHARRVKLLKSGWHYFCNIVFIFAIGYIVVVYPVYFLFTSHYPVTKQVSDTTFILNSFANGPTPAGQLCHGSRCLADLDIKMAGNPVLRPYAQYMLGVLMVLQRVDGGNTIYFLGHVVGSGGWIYFPVLYLLKEPIPTLIIVLLALALALWGMAKKTVAARGHVKKYILDYLGVNFSEFAMISFVVLYWGYSMHTTLNIGIRHLMPTIPFIYILAAGVWKKWVMKIDPASLAAMTRSFFSSAIKYIFLVVLILWLSLETAFAAPYFLSYFNEFGGGVSGGYHYVTDSNYDWGQDLLRLQAWTAAHPEVDKIAVDYFGGGDPSYTLGAKEVDWSSSKGNPADQGIHWLAVSVNTLEGAIQPLEQGQTRNASDTYSWLTALRPVKPGMGNVPEPDFKAGTSIFIYHL
jgi:4-amino-4-deoxy-L-arabinose transferase-like glycosyltransferase